MRRFSLISRTLKIQPQVYESYILHLQIDDARYLTIIVFVSFALSYKQILSNRWIKDTRNACYRRAVKENIPNLPQVYVQTIIIIK